MTEYKASLNPKHLQVRFCTYLVVYVEDHDLHLLSMVKITPMKNKTFHAYVIFYYFHECYSFRDLEMQMPLSSSNVTLSMHFLMFFILFLT